jgi:hypothetical protein
VEKVKMFDLRWEISTTFMNNLRADLRWGILINIQFRNFCMQTKELNYIFPVHVYGCDISSLTLREEHK